MGRTGGSKIASKTEPYVVAEELDGIHAPAKTGYICQASKTQVLTPKLSEVPNAADDIMMRKRTYKLVCEFWRSCDNAHVTTSKIHSLGDCSLTLAVFLSSPMYCC